MAGGLTEREAEILLVVAEYGSNQLAAEKLGVSLQTVKNTLWSVLKKTDSVSTLQAYHRLLGGVALVTRVSQKIVREK